MACDEALVERVRNLLKRRRGIGERRMFGGVCFTLHGNMCCGVAGEDLVLRLGNEGVAEALKERHVRPMDFTGKPLKSMVYVAPAAVRDDAQLRLWIERGLAFTRTLPAK